MNISITNIQVSLGETELDKKMFSKVIGKNLYFIFLTVFTLFMSIRELRNALSTIEYGGQLNSFKYSIIMIKLDVTNRDYNHVYEIGNYPLIPIAAGVIYNGYFYIKIKLKKDKAVQ